MRKMFAFPLWVILIMSLISCDKETIIPTGNIPSEVVEYVNAHFPNESIIQAVKDVDGLKKTYDIVLSNNYQLEFNRKKEVVEITGVLPLPNSVIPLPILEYVNTQYSGNLILGWELEKNYQEVKLDNELELQFTLAGDFLRIDD